MNSELWKLISTYELVLKLGNTRRPVRIEVLRSTSNTSRYRARVWVQEIYNLYPAVLNSGPQGQDLHKVHSSDDLNKEITSDLVEEPGFIEGITFESEASFVEALKAKVAKYQSILNET